MDEALDGARARGTLTIRTSAPTAEFSFVLSGEDAFVQQEAFEVLYHMLWETVHVYFEHREQGHDVGASSFLYPFLGTQEQNLDTVVDEVQQSMIQKMRRGQSDSGEKFRNGKCSEAVVTIAREVSLRVKRGGKLIVFGNGGSATDANDLTIDCVSPPGHLRPVPAVSLSSEPANITAIANDVGAEAVFTRLLIAHAQPHDIAVAISTSGSSPNVSLALEEARARGLLTIGISGYDGGRVVSEGLADHNIVVHSDYIPRIQEAQASLYHLLRQLIDENLDG